MKTNSTKFVTWHLLSIDCDGRPGKTYIPLKRCNVGITFEEWLVNTPESEYSSTVECLNQMKADIHGEHDGDIKYATQAQKEVFKAHIEKMGNSSVWM